MKKKSFPLFGIGILCLFLAGMILFEDIVKSHSNNRPGDYPATITKTLDTFIPFIHGASALLGMLLLISTLSYHRRTDFVNRPTRDLESWVNSRRT
jgi:hypothetical protein